MSTPPSEENSHSASQKIPCLLQKPKVHYRDNNSPPLVPIPSQMHLVHTFTHYFPKIHSDVGLPSMPRSSEQSLPLRLSDQNFAYISHLIHVCNVLSHGLGLSVCSDHM